MGSLTLERMIFDPAEAADGPNVGSYLRAGSDGDLISSTNVSGKECIDVNVANDIAVDVDHTTDSVKIGDGTDFLAINADGSINAVVTATNLDIRDLAFATDSVTAHQGGTWTIDSITDPVTVQATDLDIRDLAFATDSVTAHQGGTWTIDAITNDVTVVATDLDIRDLAFATDSVTSHQGGDWDVKVLAPAGTVLATAVTVGTTAVALPASALANRARIIVQNNGDKSIFIGGSGVTTATGVEISKGGSWTEEIGAGAVVYAISTAAGQNVRVVEIAA